MTKGTILGDTFEQVVELGSSTAKKSAQQVAQIINPVKLAQTVFSPENSHEPNQTYKSQSHESIKKGKDHTPVDFKKLQENFKNKDKLQAEALRNRLFQIVKREDEKILERKDMEAAQKKRQEEYDEQAKKRKEQEKKQQQQQDNIPKGKTRRSIFSAKKMADRQHSEVKPASGKQ